MSDYKELFEKTFDDIDCLKFELTEYYFQNVKSFLNLNMKKAYKNIIGELYKVSITSRGNGGWLSIDDCNITDIKKTKRIDKVINSFEFV